MPEARDCTALAQLATARFSSLTPIYRLIGLGA